MGRLTAGADQRSSLSPPADSLGMKRGRIGYGCDLVSCQGAGGFQGVFRKMSPSEKSVPVVTV
jgi:hypothetical protein